MLLAKGSRVMLTTNIWTETGLVNRSMRNIIFEQAPPSLPAAVFIEFDAYKGPTITTSEGNKVVLIVLIKHN